MHPEETPIKHTKKPIASLFQHNSQENFLSKRWLLKKLRAKKSIKKIALLFLCMFNKCMFDADIRKI